MQSWSVLVLIISLTPINIRLRRSHAAQSSIGPGSKHCRAPFCRLPRTCLELPWVTLTTRGVAFLACFCRPAPLSVMSMVHEVAAPPPHLLQNRSPSWSTSLPSYNYFTTPLSPVPMSPQSLHSYMSRVPESPVPPHGLHNLPTSGWFGSSILAHDSHNEVCIALTLLSRPCAQSFRTLSLHMITMYLHTPHRSICQHPHLPILNMVQLHRYLMLQSILYRLLPLRFLLILEIL